MASTQETAFCELYYKDPQKSKAIYIWYKQFETKRSIYKGNDKQRWCKHKQYNFFCELQVNFKDDVAAWITLHLIGKVGHHNIHFWGQKSHQAWTWLHSSQVCFVLFHYKVPFPHPQ
jgi:hypothetical protein